MINCDTPILFKVLLKTFLESENRLALLRALPERQILAPLVANVLAIADRDLTAALPCLCLLLQYTDAFNLSILCKFRKLAH